jgi:hypothetical protein
MVAPNTTAQRKATRAGRRTGSGGRRLAAALEGRSAAVRVAIGAGLSVTARAAGGYPHERWITATAGRELVTNTTTGKVREDCSYTLKVVRCWAAPLNRTEPRAGTLFIQPGAAALLQSWIDIGAGVKESIGRPRGYRITGSTTFLGRAAITLAQDAQRGPDGGIESASIVAEADND